MHARVRARAFGAGLMKSVHKIKLSSKPTSWLSEPSHIVSHLVVIWDLSWRSGLFPSPRRTSPAVCLPDSTYWYSEFAKGW